MVIRIQAVSPVGCAESWRMCWKRSSAKVKLLTKEMKTLSAQSVTRLGTYERTCVHSSTLCTVCSGCAHAPPVIVCMVQSLEEEDEEEEDDDDDDECECVCMCVRARARADNVTT